jgi:hypothetical protein
VIRFKKEILWEIIVMEMEMDRDLRRRHQQSQVMNVRLCDFIV